MAVKKVLSTKVPESWLAEIEELAARKFPGRTRSEWLFGVVEHELARQRDGGNKDARLDQLLANDEKMLTILERIHTLVNH
jgi:hypothetical protein